MKVKGWSRFQHYKHRRPPWIKLHRDLLDNFAFSCLPLASQALAPRLWLIASESEDGSFPDDLPELSFRLRCSEDQVIEAVNPLISAGFLEGKHLASTVLAERKQNLTTEKSRVEKRNEQQIARPSDGAFVFPSQRAADIYLKFYPSAEPPKPMFKALRPLVEKHGWEKVGPELEAYLQGTEVSYHSWPKFASGFGSWAAGKPGRSGGASIAANNRAAALGFLKRVDEIIDGKVKS